MVKQANSKRACSFWLINLSNFVKRASLESKADIIPVSLKGTFEIMPIGSVKVKQGVVNMVIGKPIQYRKDKELLGEIRDTVIKNLEQNQ